MGDCQGLTLASTIAHEHHPSHLRPLDRPRGRRSFVRQWSPPVEAGAPIVILHDSLGCVDLWRGFPPALCALTARRVIAYDRLDFGQSDARFDLPSVNFVEEEATDYFPDLLK